MVPIVYLEGVLRFLIRLSCFVSGCISSDSMTSRYCVRFYIYFMKVRGSVIFGSIFSFGLILSAKQLTLGKTFTEFDVGVLVRGFVSRSSVPNVPLSESFVTAGFFNCSV